MSRLPVVYLLHGGGPWPFVELGFGTVRPMTASGSIQGNRYTIALTNPNGPKSYTMTALGNIDGDPYVDVLVIREDRQ